MLMAGLKPRGYRVFNRVELLPDGKGMRFDAPSIVYSKELWPLGLPSTKDTSFTVSLRLTPLRHYTGGIARIVSLCDKANNEKVIFGQFNHCLTIQDFTAGMKKEFDCDRVFRPEKEVGIFITSGVQGMKIFVDGKCRRSGQGSVVNADNVVHPGRIVVGNSPDGKSGWEGTIQSINIYGKELSEQGLVDGEDREVSQPLGLYAEGTNAVGYYDFTKESRFRIANEVGRDSGLYVPRFFTMLKLNVLTLPDQKQMWSFSSIADYIVNFFGFLPFGFLLALLLYLKGWKRRTAIVLTTVTGGIFSLFIELVQVFIPTRCSELSDLSLNTLGSLVGALAILLVSRHRQDNS